MSAQVVTVEDLEKFRILLLEDLKGMIAQPTTPTRPWLKSAEVRKILGISHGTLQNLRVNGTLTYSKIGGTMYYSHEDLIKLLESTKTK